MPEWQSVSLAFRKKRRDVGGCGSTTAATGCGLATVTENFFWKGLVICKHGIGRSLESDVRFLPMLSISQRREQVVQGSV